MTGTRLSSMNFLAVSRTRRSSSLSRVSNWMKSTPRNLIAGIVSHPGTQQKRCRKLFKVAEGQGRGKAGYVSVSATYPSFEITRAVARHRQVGFLSILQSEVERAAGQGSHFLDPR